MTTTDIQWKEHSLLSDRESGEDIIEQLSKQFPGIAFRIDVYEGGAWLHIDASVPNTKQYDIRRWLRDNQMLNRFSDDDDDDRAIWDIPEDYQPASIMAPALTGQAPPA